MGNFSIKPTMKRYDIIHTASQLKGLANKMMGLEEWACFDGGTEVLTEDGWMRLDEYTELPERLKVLSYDKGMLQFKSVTKVVKKKHTGEMIRFQNKSLDMFMTPDHKVITYKDGEKIITQAKDLQLSDKHKVIVAGVKNIGIKSLSNIDRLFIAISADGYYNIKEDVYTFSFTKPRKIKRLHYLLDSLGIPYTSGAHQRESRPLPDVSFRFKLPKYISFTKGLHNIVNLKDVSTNYAQEFLKEVTLWDGSPTSNCSTSISFNTNNKKEADFYNAMCVLGNSFSHKTMVSNKRGNNSVEMGYKSVLKTGCNFNKNQVGLVGSINSVQFDGDVYCVHVPDTHCFFARRNGGTPFLTHNCDTETNTLRVNGPNDDFMIVGISISWGEYNNYYIPINHVRDEDYFYNADLDDVVYYLKPVFERKDIRLVGQNLKYDLHVLARIGINYKTQDLWDTMIASWLCDENTPNGLKENSAEKLKIDQTHFKEVTDTVPLEVRKAYGLKGNSRVPFQLVLIEDGAPYALADSFNTWELYLGFEPELDDEGMLPIFNKMYKPFIDCMFTVEENGVTVDLPKLEKMRVDIAKDCEDLKYKLYELAGVEFNANSGQQKAELMFGYIKQDKINEKTGKTTKGNPNMNIVKNSFGFKPLTMTAGGMPQTNNDVFWKYSHEEYPNTPKNARKREGVEFCKIMVEYSKLEKLRSAFVEGMVENLYSDGKVHCNFNLIGTDSGRVSCNSINLMQLPKAEDDATYQIRDLFIGREYNGVKNSIISADYSNLEVRCLAHFSEDANLLQMFGEGSDVHGSTAVNMFELDCTPSEVKKKYPHLRQASKILNFMLMYGGGAKRLYEALKDDHYSPVDLGSEEYLKQYKCKNGVEVAQLYIDKYFTSYSGVAQFIKDQKRFAHKYGYVQTILGRKRRLPMIHSTNFGDVSYAERLSVNSSIQGTAADIMISAQNLIHKDPKFKELGALMISQIHDELLVECPPENVEQVTELITHHMQYMFSDKTSLLKLDFIAEADSGASYQEAK